MTILEQVTESWNAGSGIPPGMSQGVLQEVRGALGTDADPELDAALDAAIADAPFR